MKNNSISCIVPCYNSQNFISKTVYSLINQTIKPLEIILVNDASTDNTLDVLKQMEVKHPNIIKVIDLETNKGPSYARNFGVENSKGEYILFLDSDDIAEPFLIEKYLFKLNELNKKEDDYILSV